MSDAYRSLFVEVPIVPLKEHDPERSFLSEVYNIKLVPRYDTAYGLCTATGLVMFKEFGATNVMVRDRRDLSGISIAFFRRCGHVAECFIDDTTIYGTKSATESLRRAFQNARLFCYCVREWMLP